MHKKIVIVGGGYVGFEVAQGLDAHADVTLLEQREAFTQPPAAIRALVEPSLLEQIVLPYDKLLSRGTVVRARVTSIQPDSVTLADDRIIPADYIIVATGSTYAAPFKPSGETVENFIKANQQTCQLLKAAQSVVIVGAGAVGTELAGEIATAQPNKQITLISKDEALFPSYGPKMGANLAKKLAAKGVTIISGQRVENLKQTHAPYSGSVTLTDGRQIKADLIFPVIGAKAQSGLISDLPEVEMGPSGRVKTDPWMRPSRYPNLFVAGDIADTGDGMTIVATARQNPWLIKTLKAVVKGKSVEKMKPYTPWSIRPVLLL